MIPHPSPPHRAAQNRPLWRVRWSLAEQGKVSDGHRRTVVAPTAGVSAGRLIHPACASAKPSSVRGASQCAVIKAPPRRVDPSEARRARGLLTKVTAGYRHHDMSFARPGCPLRQDATTWCRRDMTRIIQQERFYVSLDLARLRAETRAVPMCFILMPPDLRCPASARLCHPESPEGSKPRSAALRVGGQGGGTANWRLLSRLAR